MEAQEKYANKRKRGVTFLYHVAERNQNVYLRYTGMVTKRLNLRTDEHEVYNLDGDEIMLDVNMYGAVDDAIREHWRNNYTEELSGALD